jgi:DNA-binding GntR family transcriptional regulator
MHHMMPNVPLPLRQRRLRDQVYVSLREMIRLGVFPEERAVEQSLAARLNVSRTPLREALFQLCREGVLEDTGRGYRQPALSREDIGDIVELRQMIEPAAAALAVSRATKAAYRALAREAAAERRAHKVHDVEAFIAANSRLRAELLAACGNRRLAQVLDTLGDQIQRLRRRTLHVAENRQATIMYHQRLLAAFREGDPEAARAAMHELLQAARTYYERIW